MDDSQDNTYKVPIAEKSPKTGIVLMVTGAVVAFFPILIAILNTAPGHNWMSEGDSQSGGAAIWLMMFTLPIGGTIGLIGLVKLLQASPRLAIASILIPIGAVLFFVGFWTIPHLSTPGDVLAYAICGLVGIGLIVFGVRKAIVLLFFAVRNFLKERKARK